MVASLGLNVNSAAVIIGAMCISPIMGPIMGIGFSLGINDFDLLKKSVRNFVLMFVVAFRLRPSSFISPLGMRASELLARTTPTTYDVLIAFFGGMAGIVAQSRQDRNSTVIPGVAIATALMPPLYGGVRSGDGTVSFFFRGVLPVFHQYGFYRPGYLYFTRFLKYRKEDVSQQIPRAFREADDAGDYARYVYSQRIHRLAYGAVSIFEVQADKYIAQVFNFPQTRVIESSKIYRRGRRIAPYRNCCWSGSRSAKM